LRIFRGVCRAGAQEMGPEAGRVILLSYGKTSAVAFPRKSGRIPRRARRKASDERQDGSGRGKNEGHEDVRRSGAGRPHGRERGEDAARGRPVGIPEESVGARTPPQATEGDGGPRRGQCDHGSHIALRFHPTAGRRRDPRRGISNTSPRCAPPR